MKITKLFLLTLILLSVSCSTQLTTDPISFNSDWKFYKGDVEDAQNIDLNDASWRDITLPHDWAIEGPFDSSFNARSGGLPFHGTGWYRKQFDMPNTARGKHITLHFDGAMNNAKVWLNGILIGERPYGYIGFSVDLSKHLNYGEKNVIAR